MILYVVQDKYVSGNPKYICFGAKALKELASSVIALELIEKIYSKNFNKTNYNEDEYGYYFLDTNNHKYLTDISNILSQK